MIWKPFKNLRIDLFYESLVGQCEYTTEPKGPFWCYVIDTKGVLLLLLLLLLLTFMNTFVSFVPFILVYLSCRVKAQNLQKLKSYKMSKMKQLRLRYE